MITTDIKFDFDDILIEPSVKTHVSSRYKDITLPNTLPILTAPMDTVVDLSNMDLFINQGVTVVLPRTIKYDDIKRFTPEKYLSKIFISLGFNDLDIYYKNNFKDFHTNANILIDVANGHMIKVMDYARELKRLRPDIKIMVGNIANPETYRWYADVKCIDYIRIGIGNGGGCLTTKQSGIGYPMASLIYETNRQKEEYLLANNDYPAPAIVADGGMKDYSDIIKAIALGADYVMIGSIFNKALESSADNYLYGIKVNKAIAKFFFEKGFTIKKYFRGMSTKQAQKAMGKTTFKTSEGVVRYRKVEYRLEGWITNFKHYLRNAMSYTNSRELKEYRGNVRICRITSKAYDRFNK